MRNDQPEQHQTVDLFGETMAYWEWGEAVANQPTLLFVHATGFHGRVWDKIIHAFPDYHVLAYEQRGHGRSAKLPINHWSEVGTDLAEFVCKMDLPSLIGIGHSMGAHALVEAAALTDSFSRLVLLDPVIPEEAAYADGQDYGAQFADGHPAAKRRSHFSSVEEMKERLLGKSAFSLYDEQMFDDYCRYGLEPVEGGGYELNCPPAIEATVYQSARSNGAIYNHIRSLDIPVLIVRAVAPESIDERTNFSTSPTWPGLVNEFPDAREEYWADCTHFIPMQMPERVIATLAAELSV